MTQNRWIPTLVIVLLGVVFMAPDLLQPGMRMDGVIYATLAKNLSLGQGSLWELQYTKTHFNVFYENPPFAIWVQSLYFSILGDEFYVEKIHSLVNLLLVIFLITVIWKQTFNHKMFTWPREYEKPSTLVWIPVLFFLIMPVVHKAFTNNFLDNTLVILTIASVGVQFAAVRHDGLRSYLYASVAAIFVVMAVLTKGFVGLAPIIALPLYGMVTGKYKIVFKLCAAFYFTFICAVILLLLLTEAGEFFKNYYELQVVQSISGQRRIDHGRLFMLETLLLSLSYPLALVLLMWLMIKRPYLNFIPASRSQAAIFFLVMGLASSLPLMISPRQYKHYIISSLPFYVIYIGIVFGPIFQVAASTVYRKLGLKLTGRLLKSFAAFLVVALIAQYFLLFGKVGNDEKYFEVIEFLKKNKIRDQNIILLDPRQSREQFESYLARYLDLSLVPRCESIPCKEKMIKAKFVDRPTPLFRRKLAEFSEFEVWSAE